MIEQPSLTSFQGTEYHCQAIQSHAASSNVAELQPHLTYSTSIELDPLYRHWPRGEDFGNRAMLETAPAVRLLGIS